MKLVVEHDGVPLWSEDLPDMPKPSVGETLHIEIQMTEDLHTALKYAAAVAHVQESKKPSMEAAEAQMVLDMISEMWAKPPNTITVDDLNLLLDTVKDLPHPHKDQAFDKWKELADHWNSCWGSQSEEMKASLLSAYGWVMPPMSYPISPYAEDKGSVTGKLTGGPMPQNFPKTLAVLQEKAKQWSKGESVLGEDGKLVPTSSIKDPAKKKIYVETLTSVLEKLKGDTSEAMGLPGHMIGVEPVVVVNSGTEAKNPEIKKAVYEQLYMVKENPDQWAIHKHEEKTQAQHIKELLEGLAATHVAEQACATAPEPLRGELAQVFDMLGECGIGMVTVNYSGANEEGSVNKISFFKPSKSLPMEWHEYAALIGDGASQTETWIGEVALKLVDLKHTNWEADLGGWGTVRFQVEEELVKLQHEEQLYKTETTNTEFQL